jgi:cytochrome subunit of sulfide dehydrogenase
MSKGLVAAMCAAVVLSAVAPAIAADDIESRVQVCGLCHGTNGATAGPAIPVIWGQQQNYLVKELHDYRAGDRYNALMTPVASGFTPEDTRKLAAYFSAKPWPKSPGNGAGPDTAIADKLEQCQSCHQPGFVGGDPAPRLAGLSYQYLATAMRKFANDDRTNNGDMPKIMKALTESERNSMARYLAGL